MHANSISSKATPGLSVSLRYIKPCSSTLNWIYGKMKLIVWIVQGDSRV